jgi:hypothetical protein
LKKSFGLRMVDSWASCRAGNCDVRGEGGRIPTE